MERKQSVFTTVKTLNAGEVVVLEIDGYDLFMALQQTNGNMGTLNCYMLLEAIRIQGRKMEGPAELSKFTPSEVLAMMDAINAQLVKPS